MLKIIWNVLRRFISYSAWIFNLWNILWNICFMRILPGFLTIAGIFRSLNILFRKSLKKPVDRKKRDCYCLGENSYTAYRGSGADEYLPEPAGRERRERQSPPNVSSWQRGYVGSRRRSAALLRMQRRYVSEGTYQVHTACAYGLFI